MEETQSRGLLLISFAYSFIPNEAELEIARLKNKDPDCIHEERDKDIFHPDPDGNVIGYVVSNFTSQYHPKWEHLSKQHQKRVKEENRKSGTGTKRGRKPKIITKKINPKNGTGDHFASSITFGIVSPDDPSRIHGLKIFRKRSGNIAKLTHSDSDEYIARIINILFRYIELVKPGIVMTYIDYRKELSNNSTKYPYIRNDQVINLDKLYKILQSGEYNSYYWECNKMRPFYNGSSTNLLITLVVNDVKKKNKKGETKPIFCSCKLDPKGNAYVYGSNSDEITRRCTTKLFAILETNSDHLIQDDLMMLLNLQ